MPEAHRRMLGDLTVLQVLAIIILLLLLLLFLQNNESQSVFFAPSASASRASLL